MYLLFTVDCSYIHLAPSKQIHSSFVLFKFNELFFLITICEFKELL